MPKATVYKEGVLVRGPISFHDEAEMRGYAKNMSTRGYVVKKVVPKKKKGKG